MKKKQIVVLGAGESGTGAAILARQLGHAVFVSDKSPIKPEFKAQLDEAGIAWEEGQHTMDKVLAADEVIKSPGIPETTELMRSIRAKGIPVIGEIELGFRHAGPCTIVAITGTNGKTTTTNLVYHLLKTAGLNARMAGNVGKSFAEVVADDLAKGNLSKDRVFVLEVSSFQLDDIATFKPDISILLNITPDHLDRYGYEMANYIRSKFRIAMNQRRGHLFITNANDPHIAGFLTDNPGHVRCRMEKVRRSDLKNGYVRIGRLMAFDLASTTLKGPHNGFNAACAIRAALRLGVNQDVILEGLATFNPPPHRLEKVAEADGVLWINDSKATNVDSTFYALQAMERPTVWVLGGQDKGNDYQPLVPLARKAVKAIVCLGIDNKKIVEAFKGLKKTIVETRSAKEAVEAAARLADEGDAVLLSPCCASFDLFKNYEDRGDQFKAAVHELIQKNNKS